MMENKEKKCKQCDKVIGEETPFILLNEDVFCSNNCFWLYEGLPYGEGPAQQDEHGFVYRWDSTMCSVCDVERTAHAWRGVPPPSKDNHTQAAQQAERGESLSDDLLAWEKSFAYERASGAIESACVAVPHEDALENGWYDLSTSDEELDAEVEYLEARRLIVRHPTNPDLVTICDEGEPLPLPAEKAGA